MVIGPGEVSYGRAGAAQAWKRGHSFSGLARQGMSCPGLASHGRRLSFPGMTMHWEARQRKPLFHSGPPQVRECLGRHAGESITSSFMAGFPRAGHVLVLQALEAVAPLLAYAPSSTSHLLLWLSTPGQDRSLATRPGKLSPHIPQMASEGWSGPRQTGWGTCTPAGAP